MMFAITFRNFAFSVLSMVVLPAAYGSGIFIDACGVTHNFPTDIAAVAHCSVGTGADNAIGGSSGVAFKNFFENHLSPIHFYGDNDAFNQTASWQVSTSPTWDVLTVGTFLELDGTVKLQGPGSSLAITLTGLLGGPLQTITQTFNWTGAATQYDLAIPSLITQATAGTAVETLTITINGRARYDVDGSPIFSGSIPEPSTWIMLCTGLAVMGLIKFRARLS